MTDVIDPNYNPYADPANYGAVTNAATNTGTDFFQGLLGGVNSFLGGTGGQVLGAGLGIDALNELRGYR